eukprot:478876_1
MAEEKRNLNGLFEWKANGHLVQQFKKSKHKESFESPDFQTIDGTTWRIWFYPHGAISPDDCSIYLVCIKLNATKQQIAANFSLKIVELEWVWDYADTFKKNGQSSGQRKAFKSKRINNLEEMTVKCFVEETMDASNANTYFEWKVNNHLMQKWKSAKYKEAFISPQFNAIGGTWFIGIYPNGWTKEGTADLDIRCTSIESDEKEINICHYIEIKALNHCQICFDGKRVKKGDDVPCNSPFKWNDLKNESQITIGIKIWRKGAIDTGELRLISEKMMHLQKELKQMSDEKREAKSQMASLTRENEEITSKLKDFAMIDLKQQQQITKLQKGTQGMRVE